MTNSTAGAFPCCPALFIAAVCVALLPIGSYAAQNDPQKSTLPTAQSPSEKLENCALNLREEALFLSQYDVVRRDELDKLRKEVEENKHPWVLAAPWLSLGLVGIGFAVAWLVLNWRERVLNYQKAKNRKLVLDMVDLKEQVSALITSTGEIKKNVDDTKKAIEDLWRKLATSRLASGSQDFSK